MLSFLGLLRIIIILTKILVILLDVTKIVVWKLHEEVLREDIKQVKRIVDEVYFVLMAIFITILFHGVVFRRRGENEVCIGREDAILIFVFTIIIVFNSIVTMYVPATTATTTSQ
jgi:hypothetical protein